MLTLWYFQVKVSGAILAGMQAALQKKSETFEIADQKVKSLYAELER